MAKTLKELQCTLREGNVIIRRESSKAFLASEDTPLNIGGKNKLVIWICRIMFYLGLASLIAILGLAFYIWMWDSSPLSGKVEARIVSVENKSQGSVVEYEYEVDDKTYSRTQYASSANRKWREPGAKADIAYLSFAPGNSKLKKTVERFDWSMLLLGPILPVGFILGGHLGSKEVRRLAWIEDNATHVLPGEVTNRFKVKGGTIVQYKTESPVTGKEIFGGDQLGKLEPSFQQMQIGVPVAVIYAADDKHTFL